MADSEAEAMIGHLPEAGKLAGGAIKGTVTLIHARSSLNSTRQLN